MDSFFVDLHIHIGQSESGERVKISSSRDLTFHRIIEEASERKGIDIIGIIDSHSPPVQNDIESLIQQELLQPLHGGGYRYKNTTVLLGVELETKDEGHGPAHFLAYFPDLERMKQFTHWLSFHMKNVVLSSQRVHCRTEVVVKTILQLDGIVIPAHIFSPFKSIFGSATNRISDIVDISLLSGVELGLSADSTMADRISELSTLSFVTNSDAHSLGKIGREYNRMRLKEPSFNEVVKALKREEDRIVDRNYGLNPYLGKYHASFCNECENIIDIRYMEMNQKCPICQSTKWTKGVSDRVNEVADRDQPIHPTFRPPYVYQVPLEFIPGIGKKTLNKLLAYFGTEMNILHRSNEWELKKIVPEPIVETILKSREGSVQISKGGGGIYGKVLS